MLPGTLYLVPSGLGGAAPGRFLPEATAAIVRELRHFVVEDAKTARAFLKAIAYPLPLRSASFAVLNEHTAPAALDGLLSPLREGKDVGVMSEAGCPGVADPGAQLVRRAHAAGMRVIPLVGPSALLLALMASGMNGQRFAFQGYLPIDDGRRCAKIAQLEAQSAREDTTQIFIETPYRNSALFDALVKTCKADTLLCIAADLTAETEFVRTLTIGDWRRQAPELNRRPAVFLLYRGAS